MKISFVGSWNLADGYLGAARALERLGSTIFFIPAQKYKTENPNNHVSLLLEDLSKANSDIVLWWRGETLSGDQFDYVRKNIGGKFVLYSWDDPFQWEVHHEMPQKSKNLDIAFSCCKDSVQKYLQHGAKKAIYAPPGFDNEVHYPDFDEKYACDISLVCTNLYDGKSLTKYNHVSRKILLDWIIKSLPEVDLRLYGPKNFENQYPKQYAGWVSFDESRKVFSSSKINLCTHIRPDGDMYINERVCQILGSGGLLMVDYVKGIKNILMVNEECLIIDQRGFDKFIDQIKHVLDNIKDYDRVRKNGYNCAVQKLTWDSWAKTVLRELNE